MARDYLGWSKAEIKAGHPIETRAERAAFRIYDKPKRQGRNVGSFKGRSGTWVKGKGGRFIGSK